MKYLLIFLISCSCFGQALPLPFINPSTGGGAKNFVVVQNQKNAAGASVSITPTAGNTLIVFGESSLSSTITVSDGVNSYTTLTNGVIGANQGIVAMASSVSGSTVTVAMAGTLNAGINVYEVSGIIAFDQAAMVTTVSTPASITLPATTSSDFVMLYWMSEQADYASTPTATLSPGSLSGNLLVHDTSWYGAWFDWGAGAGIAANTYTCSATVPGNNTVTIMVAFK